MHAGDTVVLKSGGVIMTIEKVESQTVHCCWFVNGEIKRAQFKEDVLVHPQQGHSGPEYFPKIR